MMHEFIFVYGTLRKGTATDMHNVFARHSEYFSEGYMQGRLYDVNGYPGAIESNDAGERVYGELHKIISSDQVLPLLDEHEECTDKFPVPHEYIRKKLSIKLVNGDELTAWVYVFNHAISGLIRINSGDYANHIDKLRSQNTC